MTRVTIGGSSMSGSLVRSRSLVRRHLAHRRGNFSGVPAPALLLLFPLLLLAGVAPASTAHAQDTDPPTVTSAEPIGTPQEVVNLLQADSTRDRGIEGLILLGGSLPPDEGTPWIQFLAISERIPGGLLARLAPAVLLGHEGETEEALVLVDRIIDEVENDPGDPPLDDEDGVPIAPFLALAAHLAERVDPPAAAAYRERLLEEHPDDLETPEAALLLARYYLGDPERAPRGLTILENLIVRLPAHPVAPEARRLRQEALARGVEPGPGGDTY